MVGGGSVWWYRSGGLRGMDTSHLFTAALQLQSPWKVESVDFRDAGDGRQEPHIAIGFEVGSRFCCPVHGVRTVPVPWARPGGGFTLLFEAWAAEMASLSKKSGDAAPTSTHHRTGLLQRQARGVRQQDQGHHPHGLRLPPRHQPHRPDHAPMQRTRHPTTTTHNLTHKNSRSLKDRYSCRAFWVIPRAWVDWHAVGEILAERCMPAHGNGWPAGKECDANGSGVA